MAQTAEQRSEQARNAAAARKVLGNNQYTATTKKDVVNTEQRDKVRAELLAQRLERHAKGTLEMTQTQVAAAKVLIDKGKPSLQAIESTTIDPAASLNDDQIRASIKQMLVNHGPLVAELLAEVARESAEPPAAVQQTG